MPEFHSEPPMPGMRFNAMPRRSVVLYVLPLCMLWAIAMVFFLQHWAAAFLSVPFAVVFYRLYRLTSQPLTFELRDDSLWVEHSQTKIPYSSVRAIEYLPTAKKPLSSIILTADSHCVLIPESAEADIEQLFFFFCRRAGLEDRMSLPATLQQYHSEKTALYGDSDVVAVTARTVPGGKPARPQTREFGNSLLISAILVLPAMLAEPPLVAVSIFCLVIGGLARWMGKEQVKRLMIFKHAEQSAIVISPEGFAMSQGDIQGAIEWVRVDKMSIRNPSHAIENSARMLGMAGQIVLKVGSSTILIKDVYSYPLFLLYTRLLVARENQTTLE